MTAVIPAVIVAVPAPRVRMRASIGNAVFAEATSA